MTPGFSSSDTTRRFAVAVVTLAVGIGWPHVSRATDHNYVLPDGSRVSLVQSQTEVGVVFRDGAPTDNVIQRIEGASQGTVGDVVAGDSAGGVKLLELSAVTQAALESLRADEAVEDAGLVYRLAGHPLPVISTGSIVLRLRAGVTPEERQALWDAFDLTDAIPLDGMDDIFRVRPHNQAIDEVRLAELIADDGRTVWANPNFRRLTETRQVSVSDPFFSSQWHLSNTGQRGGTPGADIDIGGAWAITDGTGVLFGMFDDACDVGHEDLAANYIGVGHDVSIPLGAEGGDDPNPRFFLDTHGTAVMGLMVAAANGIGVRGVAPGATFTASRGLLGFRSDFEAASVYTFALQQGVDVHNNSWGYPGGFPDPPIVVDAIDQAFRMGRDLDGPGGNPPLGMVILFASGNDGVENRAGFELSTLPTVIGVGATNDRDGITSYSNYGPDIDIMAPSGDDFMAGITTTDVEDDHPATPGYNYAGYNWWDGVTDIDVTGKYTGWFGGTSAACPIAAGVAGLILSANPNLTATDVRLILEHTSEKVSPIDARYNGITSRSRTYGYGRINAEQAVIAARDSAGGGQVWPDRPDDVAVISSTLQWKVPYGADDFLIVQGDVDFSFIPEDGSCYDALQLGCEATNPTQLPLGLSVLHAGCIGDCDANSRQSVIFTTSQGARKFFAVYAHNRSGKYSFGVGIDSIGNEAGGSNVLGVPDDHGTTVRGPGVNIVASPLRGRSPLTVQFNGNAVSELDLDWSRILWDFDFDPEDPEPPSEDETKDETKANYTYEVAPGEEQTYTARLTMYDVAGNAGFAQVQIKVIGEDPPDGTSQSVIPGLRISVNSTGTSGADVANGTSPFEAKLRIVSDTVGTTVHSVAWDLGDGTRASGHSVVHTYVNTSAETRSFVAVATVNVITGNGTIISDTISRVITVEPGAGVGDTIDGQLPGTTPFGEGGAASPCGVLGLIPMLFSLASLMWLRRRI